MALYELRTFSDLYTAVMEELGLNQSDTTAKNRVKRDINIIYQKVLAKKRWGWLVKSVDLTLPAYFNTGTATVTQGSATVTVTTGPGPSKVGHYFAVDGYPEIYTIESHTAASTTIKLDSEYTGTTSSTATFRIWTDKLNLPVDCKETVTVWHDHQRAELDNLGIQEFRRLRALSPRREAKPAAYTTRAYKDPNQASSITSLPGITSRASSGTVRTLVFSGTLPSSVTNSFSSGAPTKPVRWRISAAGSPEYNGDVLLASLSTTTNTNDTITYIGKGELQESAVSDSTLTVRALDNEVDFERFREIQLYPAESSTKVTLHVDYVKEGQPLENDSDEPIIPFEDREILLYGALERGWRKQRNPEEAAINKALYNEKLDEMTGRLEDTFDQPKLRPSTLYLSAKRNAGRTRMLGSFPSSSGSASTGGAEVINGTANTLASFDGDGELSSTAVGSGKIIVGNSSGVPTAVTPSGDVTIDNTGVTAISTGVIVNADIATGAAIDATKIASGNVSNAEFGYLDGVTSAIQTQLDAITTLANGKIYIGNGSNVATEVTPSGDVTIDNTGVTAIGTGVIVNADINGSAAIDRTKTASGTAYRILANNASGVMSENAAITASRAVASDANGQLVAATTTATELGYVNGVTSAIQTQIDAKLARAQSVTTKTTTYTATTSDDLILCDASGGAFTVTLYAASGNSGRVLKLKKTDSSVNAVTIDGNSSETIDGATTTTLSTQYEIVTIICDGSNWHIVDREYDRAWQSYTPTGDYSSNATYTGFWRRLGDTAEYHVNIAFSNATDSVAFTLDQPTGHTIDTAKMPYTTAQHGVLGIINWYDGSTNSFLGNVVYSSTTEVKARGLLPSSANDHYWRPASEATSVPVGMNTGRSIQIRYSVPISGWR